MGGGDPRTSRSSLVLVDPVIQQPPLKWWQHAWRFALALFISLVGWAEVAEYQFEQAPAWGAIDVMLGGSAFVLVIWRRQFPVTVSVLTNIAAAVSTLSAGPATLALMSLATRRRWREIIPVSILAFISGITLLIIDPVEEPLAFIVPFMIAIIAVTVGWGMYIGSRRELMATLEERASRSEAEQALRVSQAQVAERARIAREMHDVMAHRISLVTMHAGALAYRDDLDPKQVRETAALIQQTSHQALTELREVLGVLRADGDESTTDRPQPLAADIATVLAESREAGMTIHTEVEVDLSTLPVTVGRTLYRIVQESLTNARKHSRGAAVTVSFDGGPGDGVKFQITNPRAFGSSTAPASGYGLIGLAERAELVGGHLTHTTRADGTFSVEGWLPWPM